MRAREITRSNERGTREFLIDLHHLHAVDWTLLALLVRTVSSSSSHTVSDSVDVHQGTGNDVLLPESGIAMTGNHPSRYAQTSRAFPGPSALSVVVTRCLTCRHSTELDERACATTGKHQGGHSTSTQVRAGVPCTSAPQQRGAQGSLQGWHDDLVVPRRPSGDLSASGNLRGCQAVVILLGGP